MNDDATILPADDPDRRLAEEIGDVLAQGLSPDEVVPTSLRPLADAGRRGVDRDQPSAEATARMWSGIEKHVRPAPPRADRPAHPRRRAWAWAAGAAVCVVLAAVVGRFLLDRTPRTNLLLAADAEIATYTAADGSVVRLRPHSRLYTVRSVDGVHYRIEGEAYFDVVHDDSRTVSVEAGGALVSILGTRFDVSTWGGQTTVYLEEGRIRLIHRQTGEDVVLTPGQQSALTAEGRLVAPVEAPPNEYMDWLRDAMTFERRPLRQVLAEMSHHFDVTLQAPDSLLDETLSGRIPLLHLDESLADLGVVVGGRFEAAGRRRYRFVPE